MAGNICRALLCGTVDYLAPEIVRQQGHGFEAGAYNRPLLSST
jgi:hypothetical protein